MTGVDLVTFLRARLDERETDVNLANKAAGGQVPWSAFLLADVAAKRRIVEICAHNLEFEDYGWSVAEPVIKLLAAPFAQHPDFDPAWAVEP